MAHNNELYFNLISQIVGVLVKHDNDINKIKDEHQPVPDSTYADILQTLNQLSNEMESNDTNTNDDANTQSNN